MSIHLTVHELAPLADALGEAMKRHDREDHLQPSSDVPRQCLEGVVVHLVDILADRHGVMAVAGLLAVMKPRVQMYEGMD